MSSIQIFFLMRPCPPPTRVFLPSVTALGESSFGQEPQCFSAQRPLRSRCRKKRLWGPELGWGTGCSFYGKYSYGHHELIASPRHPKPGTNSPFYIPVFCDTVSVLRTQLTFMLPTSEISNISILYAVKSRC